ncbi:3-hydroxyacyl-CoA dehydrogenase family protein [Parafilimonas terrae]|uniref:3-hydroxybutyryl-CoA dehydrogenase n=1 Tax=Parafilimonas terrae TaxID=1465490 RepID=A0A1I5Z6X1_9BACT|nr:3-hydroxyacyl-CoA dehydrogenase NAD-binding domain-containing protein [Parafilimonas terrae]SFQ52222.1 3-hydroxybutyryl-CoA dehydrogenase [Parafilimonas terrae]
MIKTICVCGAGTMGSGIAQVIASNNINVIQFDVNENMLEKSKTSIENNLQKLVEKGRLQQAQKNDTLQRIAFISSIKNCVGELIIEAVVEDKLIKQNLFDELAEINTDAAIFATNTSSISITALSSGKKYASRFAGLHFFNPAPLMKLVEIIRTEHTTEEVTDTLKKFTEQLGKTAVVCNDAPGFIVNRVARHYYLEAMRLVESGIADVKTIDTIMEATGFKMGPFKLMDLIGLDVNYAVSNIVWNELGRPERLEPSRLQKAKVDANELGKKSGKGFYEY